MKNSTAHHPKKDSQLWKLLSAPMLLFILIPILSLFLRTSPADVFQNLHDKQVTQAITLSLSSSLVSTSLTLLFGTPVAYRLATRRFRGYHLVDTIIDLPTVLPPSVAGVALLMAFGRNGLIGSFLADIGITIPFTFFAVVLAQMFIASPFYIKSATLGFSNIDKQLIQAAELDGASRWQIFRYIFIPLSSKALMSGSVMTWARALGEFGATIIFAGNFPGRTQTMPLAVYIGFEISMNVALTLSIILICFSFLTLVIVKGFLHARMETEEELISY
ncbi:MAG: molybdate ABC transporter permease subunit [Pelolinea sp.]|jgi:molybdate transport system permease protein|nr:molybdate ABC transporter permease subunit [Pelolinea sp.]